MKKFRISKTNQKQYFIRIFTMISFHSSGISCTDIEAIIWVLHMMTEIWSNFHHTWFSFIFFQTEYLKYVRQVQASSFCKFSSNSSSVCRKSSKREIVLRNYIFPDKSNVFSYDLILSLFLVPMQTQKLSFEWKEQKKIAGTCHLLLILLVWGRWWLS